MMSVDGTTSFFQALSSSFIEKDYQPMLFFFVQVRIMR